MRINKELWGIQPEKKPTEIPKKENIVSSENSPEQLRQQILERSKGEVENFKMSGQAGLEAAQKRAEAEGLILNEEDRNQLHELNEEADTAHAQLLDQAQNSEEIKEEPAEEIQERPKANQLETENMNQESPEKTILAGQEKIHAMFATQQNTNLNYSILWNLLMKQENGNYAWRPLEEIDVKSVESLLTKINKEEELRKKIGETINRFGASLEISGANSPEVQKHLEDLGRLPEKLVELMKTRGMRLKIGDTDVVKLSNNPVFSTTVPRGHVGRVNWEGVPGAYDNNEGIVYAGSGLHGSGSLVLHEYGHGIGDKLDLDNFQETIATHQRLFDKLPQYLQQEGPGGLTGRKEFVAESFASFLIMPKEVFIAVYDEDWHRFLEKNINQEVTI